MVTTQGKFSTLVTELCFLLVSRSIGICALFFHVFLNFALTEKIGNHSKFQATVTGW